VALLKKKILASTVTGRSLGGVVFSVRENERELEKLPLNVVVFKVVKVAGKLDFHLMGFGSQAHEMQKVLIDYLAFLIQRKRQEQIARAEEERKMWERIEKLAKAEKEKAEAKAALDFNDDEFGFLDEAENFDVNIEV